MNNHCTRMQELVEPYLDDLLDAENKAGFEKHIAVCARCRAELVAANRLSNEIRTLPLVRCPDRVTENVYERMGAVQSRTRRSSGRLRRWLSGAPLPRPVLAGGLVLVLAVSAVLVKKASSPTEQITEAQIAEAEAAIKWTFAYVNQVGRRSGFAVRDEAFEAGLVDPVRRAVSPKNEKNDTIDHKRNGGSI